MLIEKSVEEIFREHGGTAPVTLEGPGNREDNLWLTLNESHFSDTASEWEERCFLDHSSAGYYRWPQTISYAVNKRERYTDEQMPSDVSIVFQRFRDQSFVKQLIKQLVLDDDEIESNRVRFLMFKVNRIETPFPLSTWNSSLGSLQKFRFALGRSLSRRTLRTDPGNSAGEAERKSSSCFRSGHGSDSWLEILDIVDGQSSLSIAFSTGGYLL